MTDIAPPPRVSIGLPVYNGDRHLTKALEALGAQTFSDFELIISDNCSTDRTEAIARDFAEHDRRARYIRQPHNIGPNENFEFVLEQARGQYFFWAAHDDYWFPDFTAEMVTLLDRNPEAVVAFCGADHADEDGKVFKQYPAIGAIGRPSGTPGRSSFHRFMMQNMMEGKANIIYGLFRRELLHRAAVMRGWQSVKWGSDLLMCADMLRYGDVVFSERVLWRKTLAPTSWGSAQPPDHPPSAKQSVTGIIGTYRQYMVFIAGMWSVQGGKSGMRAVPLPNRVFYTLFELIRMNRGFVGHLGDAIARRIGGRTASPPGTSDTGGVRLKPASAQSKELE